MSTHIFPVSASILTSSGGMSSGLYSRRHSRVFFMRFLPSSSFHFAARIYRGMVSGRASQRASHSAYGSESGSRSLCAYYLRRRRLGRVWSALDRRTHLPQRLDLGLLFLIILPYRLHDRARRGFEQNLVRFGTLCVGHVVVVAGGKSHSAAFTPRAMRNVWVIGQPISGITSGVGRRDVERADIVVIAFRTSGPALFASSHHDTPRISITSSAL